MLRRAISGQYLYFTLNSAISGNPVIGASGQISGTKSIDGLSGMIVLSGNIIELGNGSYRANLFSFDVDGLNVGYQFTASGCVSVQYSIATVANVSGAIFTASGLPTMDGSGFLQTVSGTTFIASGPFVNVPRASISGVIANSGIFVTVPIATISGVIANSGIFVTVPIATISGVIANSGIFVTVPIATISGAVGNSGQFVTILSGTTFLASGLPAMDSSGFLQTVSGTTFIASGPFVNVPPSTISGAIGNSGQFVTVPPSTISGVVVNSGVFVTILSGTTYLASGIPALNSSGAVTVVTNLDKAGYSTLSGTLSSGNVVGVYSGQLSGQTVNVSSGTLFPASGSTFIASGPFVNTPPSSISGLNVNSGLFVTVPKETISGVVANSGLFTTTLKENISGVIANSGIFAAPTTLLSGSLSGQLVNVQVNNDKSGYFITQLFPPNFSGLAINTAGQVSVSGSVSVSGIPTNLFLLAVDASGRVTVGNMASGVINNQSITSGAITDNSFGIPSLSSPAVGFVGMGEQVWRRFFEQVTKNDQSGTIQTFANNGTTVITTQLFTSQSGVGDTIFKAT